MSLPRPVLAAGTVPAAFAHVAAAYPDRPAVRASGRQLTYAELDRAARRLAAAILATLGPDPAPVALHLPQDASAIVAILGILQAGKAYVVLDPGVPPDRNRAILADSTAGLVVTNARGLAEAADLGDAPLLDLDALPPAPPAALPPGAPDNLLNLMYTSGTTGAPKGVMQTHANLLHAIDMYTEPPIVPEDRLALLTSASFGASATVIFGALLNGALLLPFDLKRGGVADLGPWLKAQGVTTFHLVPSVFRQMLRALQPGTVLDSVRVARLGGEPILRHDLALFRRHFARGAQLRVALGTTETYIAAWLYLDHESEADGDVLPVGEAAPGCRLWILGEDERPLPDGEIGQIAVQGRYLSPGYWRLPEQTATTFRPAPDGDGRLYLTGDLGRVRPDGLIEHLGRTDDQVKIRGRRVNPGEIEAVLLDQPGVAEAVIVPQEVGEERRLVAYVVPATDTLPPTGAALRQALAALLPAEMVPAAFVFLESLPLLPFGKVDRRALPPPAWERPELATPFAAPRTPIEERLAAIWAGVLGLSSPGVHDDFFALGGHSLHAAQAVTEASRAFGVELPGGALFEANTIADLALLITQQLAAGADPADLSRLLDELDDEGDADG